MQFFTKVKQYFTGAAEADEDRPSEYADDRDEGPSHSKRQKSGFKATREVAAPVQPVLQSAGYSACGGVQGLDWYKAALKRDVDGDLADEFLLEPSIRSKHSSPEKPLKVQQKNVRAATLGEADLYVDQGQVIVLQDHRRKSQQ